MADKAIIMAVGVSAVMAERLRAARDWEGEYDLLEAADEYEAVAALLHATPTVIIVNLALERGSAMAVAEFAAFRRPQTRIIFEMGEGAVVHPFADGAIFGLHENAHGCLTPMMAIEDRVAFVEHHALARAA